MPYDLKIELTVNNEVMRKFDLVARSLNRAKPDEFDEEVMGPKHFSGEWTAIRIIESLVLAADKEMDSHFIEELEKKLLDRTH